MNVRIVPFPRGFVFGTAAPPSVPEEFVQVDPGLHLHVDRCAAYAFRRGTASRRGWRLSRPEAPFLFLTGNAADPDHPEDDLDAVCARGLAALETGDAAFHALFDRLSGRFAAIWSDGAADARLISDATGMRAVYLCRRGAHGFAASHASLAAAQIDAAAESARKVAWGYPGSATPFKGVRLHAPATILTIRDLSTRRLPTPGDTAPVAPAEAASMIVARSRSVLESLMRRHSCLLSLTAGADSRATLAVASEQSPRLRFFTYVGIPAHRTDVAVAQQLRDAFGLDHTVIRPRNQDLSEPMESAAKRSCYYLHNLNMLPSYIQAFGQDNYLHIRSNIMEFFRTSPVDDWCERYSITLEGPKSAAQLYLKSGKLRETPEFTRFCERAFDDLYRTNDWDDIKDRIEARDFYFLNFRMPAWHACVVLSSDLAFDTTVLFNSREMIEMARRVPKDLRLSNALVDEIYRQADARVTDFPINP